MKPELRLPLILFLAACTSTLVAEPSQSSNSRDGGASFDSHFEGGRYEASLTTGVMFSPFLATRHRPAIDYTLSELQLGYMLHGVREAGWFRGNLEVAGEGFGSAIFNSHGSYISGLTLWARYNFVQKHWRVVPFVQAGSGATFTDIDRNLVGQEFNFNLGLGGGARWFVARNCSLNLEYRYQHISNAGLSRKNVGINAQGPILGVSYFF